MAVARTVESTPRHLEDGPPAAPDQRVQRARIAAADVELAEVAARARQLLRVQAPALFDHRGRLRKRALRQFLLQRAGGKAYLTKEEVIALTGIAPPPVDAS